VRRALDCTSLDAGLDGGVVVRNQRHHSRTAGATTATAAQVFLADMRSLGKKVVITSIMPWGSAAGWTAPKETERQAYNSAQSTWAGANVAAYVSTDSLGTGSPLALTAANSSGDGLHPSPVGSLGLVDLVVDGGAP